VAIALLPVLGRPVSAATVSALAKQIDAAVAAFHRRPLKDPYRVLVLDGVVLKRKTRARWSVGLGGRSPNPFQTDQRAGKAGAGCAGPAAGRQEGSHRLSPG
jgi:hypothetical protein